MITTDLIQSKKLKSIGAPQDTIFWWGRYGLRSHGLFQKSDLQLRSSQYGDGFLPEYAAYDLQSLIEWLGNQFESLEKSFNIGGKYIGVATLNASCWYGNTPLEAVYNLAIAIKEIK